jgi:hypothetical protein
MTTETKQVTGTNPLLDIPAGRVSSFPQPVSGFVRLI